MRCFSGWVGAAALGVALMAGTAVAAPGDIHRVESERINLRSAPSNDSNIRGRLLRGDEVVEIRRSGDWVGVRAVQSGEEGWVFGQLLKTAQPSGLGADSRGQGWGDQRTAAADRDAGFRMISEDFDTLVGSIGQRLGYRLFERAEVMDGNVLRLTPTRQFLERGGEEAHLLAALAVQQMWKNHNNGRPATITVMGPSSEKYLSVSDAGTAGPTMEILQLREASRR